MTLILLCCAVLFGAKPMDTFAWSGTIGTLILLVVYALATIGAIWLLFVRRLLPVPRWQVAIPIAALALLGYTIYRNVIPYPTSGPARWFPVVGGGWLLAGLVAVLAAPRAARRAGAQLSTLETPPGREPLRTSGRNQGLPSG
jgi:hypothetical protein